MKLFTLRQGQAWHHAVLQHLRDEIRARDTFGDTTCPTYSHQHSWYILLESNETHYYTTHSINCGICDIKLHDCLWMYSPHNQPLQQYISLLVYKQWPDIWYQLFNQALQELSHEVV